MINLMPFDELNALRQYLYIPGKKDVSEIEDTVEDILILAYIYGNRSANEQLQSGVKPDTGKLQKAMSKQYDGKGYADRIREYADDAESIIRVAETEAHRIYNAGAEDTATAAGATKKTWNTMLDDRVRDAHEPLQGVTVPIDSEFVTWDGHKAKYPGGFGIPELDINCRCILSYTK